MYKRLLRPILFLFDPEGVHHAAFLFLRFIQQFPFMLRAMRQRYHLNHPSLRKSIAGMTFNNPVGLAAGFDKDGLAIDALSAMGFGFVEIGTVTPKPQPGNARPRLFRLPADHALINRMGFNNQGVEALARRLAKRTRGVIVGGNIGKNKHTLNEQALDDYLTCFDVLYPYVDYFVVNVSSPNTPGLRELQDKGPLTEILSAIIALDRSKPVYKPVFLKISPDLSQPQLEDVCGIVEATQTDGIIATNTTISRSHLSTSENTIRSIGAGGLSGKPLEDTATEVIRFLRKNLSREKVIIGVGGIMTPGDAMRKLEAGADLIQVYTGFVYEGPALIRAINEQMLKLRSEP